MANIWGFWPIFDTKSPGKDLYESLFFASSLGNDFQMRHATCSGARKVFYFVFGGRQQVYVERGYVLN